ncbi:hypothetical protein GLW07_19220 [Bacillus hwajinpoensis]|uniref:Uncharacterized protein n=1 Tax=Guptibacillus hwajinpoensis TaxID=208199 RepID=A0A845F3F5_9BACL|nr:hypothetical protein [Pseudalkalibacillus hwajinpoensis]MYL65493.1 hypothetical protein [Pseudalkalibacillus hwajinpoensis]
MHREKVIKNVINSLSNYYRKQESFKRVFSNEPIMEKVSETFDAEIFDLIDSIFDMLGLPEKDEIDSERECPNHTSKGKKYLVLKAQKSEKGEGLNWSRKVCDNLIIEAAKNKEHLEAAVELISKWENLSNYTEKVENQSSVYYEDFLDQET